MKCADNKKKQNDCRKKQTKDGINKLRLNAKDTKSRLNKIDKCKRCLQSNSRHKLMPL